MIWEPQRMTQTWPGLSAPTRPPPRLTGLETGCPDLQADTWDDAQARGSCQSLLKRAGGRCGGGGNWLDKIHDQRLTTNICTLAAAINTTREDKMKNSK